MKFLRDYDFELNYHQGKANVVVDTLSKKIFACFRIDDFGNGFVREV